MGKDNNKKRKGKRTGNKERKHPLNKAKENKKKNESKPKKSFTKITNSSVPAARFKNKVSKITSVLATGSRFNGKKVLSARQVQQGKETNQYKTSAKRIKQLRRDGVPKKVIEAMLQKEAKAKKHSQKRRNVRLGID
ncbi:hypothetical protein ENUP19_0205G0039 [Entamoeba nuttalli]|uniref:Uncharacterized protein n=2 Tax=Entamoeba nuttalli TaxID=412467 RepID=K2H5S9_ENTNP|nr:hypothetical protein ENU1_045140 [Entamoeba nuttalli P19]EKE41772.1 hypothetical protein ENU1_045140 [Entamoeba nuttalli P19]|eukprot:XP_008855886.1 hypothetical protein ENU1_045140 [Entamoeba nuttalli P19]